MESYAYYRQPYAQQYTKVAQQHGEPQQLMSYRELNGKDGFVFAPFAPSERHPVLLIRPDTVRTMPLPEVLQPEPGTCNQADDTSQRTAYTADFERFHAQLTEGRFKKIVLARCMEMAGTPLATDNGQSSALNSLLSIFFRACKLYPRMFVALVSTPQSGTWLMATPEVLLESVATSQSAGRSSWRTMALAGTMKLQGDQLRFDVPLGNVSSQISWTTKNIQEQRYVASYIKDCLKQFTNDISEEGPYTSRAGNLVHLRSDFYFSTGDREHVGDLLDALHPTPAVCGIPKEEARQFILDHEHVSRQYYSGFAGPLSLEGSTSLFVSLRCMQIMESGYRLYAGGGLLKNSTEQKEWEETEAKMETMRNLIQNDV